MSALKIRQLIDLAIGSPDPGHVNFCALQCLLYSFADKLNIMDETVDCSKYGGEFMVCNSGKKLSEISTKKKFRGIRHGSISMNRMSGGADPDDEEVANNTEGAAPVEMPEAALVEEAAPAEAPEAPPATEPDPEQAPEPATATQHLALEEAPPSALEVVRSYEPSPLQMRASIQQLEKRISRIEGAKSPSLTAEMGRGLSVMKDQLELTMEQLYMLTVLLLHSNTDPGKLQQVRAVAKTLRSIQRNNVFIEGAHDFQLEDTLSWDVSETILEEMGDEEPSEISAELHGRFDEGPPADTIADDNYDLDLHLCYSPEKMLDQLLELKSEFCNLTNNVNELSAMFLEQDSKRTSMVLQELQEQMRTQIVFTKALKDELDQYDLRQSTTLNALEQINRTLESLKEDKIDKSEVVVLLADKVDYSQLQRKVSREQVQESQCRTEKQFCEVQKNISLSERNMRLAMDNLREALGLHVVEEMLRKFKEKVDQDIRTVAQLLQRYMNDTNDDFAAAGARMKVLQDLACLSCDTTCVMRPMEKAKVAKLPNAKASNLLAPLITYELGSIRKSGIMGYYRKDEFPHAPNAWTDRNAASMKACVPRHAGGVHTTHTAKEHVEKVLLSKK